MRMVTRVFMPVFSLLVLLALPVCLVQAADNNDANNDAVAAQGFEPYTTAQLDQMLAPVALYPDALLSQILMAATYPLEVVEASRWLHVPGNAGLRGDQLADVLDQQAWDPSVKSLVPFPQVLDMLDKNLDWTEQLGDAFLAQQADVMNSVQRLRNDAKNAGTLSSTSQQRVTSENQVIMIAPVNPDIIYLPMYNPQYVYGAWGYPDYPPYYFPWYGTDIGVGISFSIGFGIVSSYWGWNHWDWDRRRIIVDVNRYHHMDRDYHHAPVSPGAWQHNPAHRRGVFYNSPAVREQFHGDERGGFRGGARDNNRGSVRGDAPRNPPFTVQKPPRAGGDRMPPAVDRARPGGTVVHDDASSPSTPVPRGTAHQPDRKSVV